MRALAFMDWAGLSRNKPGAAEIHVQHIGSMGLGLRFARGNNLTVRVDFAVVFDAGGVQGRGDGMGHASVSYVF
jgi:hypothetical protein